jgi:hypothetical protein
MSDRHLTLSLISHTNVGKTTLARTLLGRDVGEVRDEAHVTDENEKFVWIEAPSGEVMYLWDTPGFSHHVQGLLRRIGREGDLIGWMMQLADRVLNRPLWCCQQAIGNVRDEADLVLYVINCAEDPVDADYVQKEIEVLQWIGKPVILVLNQLGPAVDPTRWQDLRLQYSVVRETLPLDAFSRCWIQEGELLDRVAAIVEPSKQGTARKLRDAWLDTNTALFHRSAQEIAAFLEETANHREKAETKDRRSDAEKRLHEGMVRRFQSTVNALLRAHGIAGESATKLSEMARNLVEPNAEIDARKAGLLGAVVGGASTGVAADVMSGGLTLGGGAIVGAFVGGLLSLGSARAYNWFYSDDGTLRCSETTLNDLARKAVFVYLTIAHHGRGQGGWNELHEQQEQPAWQALIDNVVAPYQTSFNRQWADARARGPSNSPDASSASPQLASLVYQVMSEVLKQLYPESQRFLKCHTLRQFP